MDVLPKELLIEVFSYLPSKDLQSISLTCHKFNDIIRNNSKFLQKFELQFISDKVNNQWIGSRKYTKLFIDGAAGIKLMYILKIIGHEIDRLVINCYDMRVDVLKLIILMTENVNHLTVYNVMDISDPEDYAHPELRHNFKFLHFQGEINAFKLFENCTAENLNVLRVDDDDFRDLSGIKNFLKNQKKLKELNLENFDGRCSIFNDTMLIDVDFRLEKLKLKNFDEKGFNFRNFLELHRDSLKCFNGTAVNHEIFTYIKNFKKLKTLKLRDMCSDFCVLNYIETLYLKDVSSSWSTKFKNVKNLTICQRYDDIKELENLKHLESLTISSCGVPELKIPTVKQLTLNRTFLEGTKPFEYENGCNLEELRIIKCKNLGWLSDFLIHKEFNLKTLLIVKSILDEDEIKFFEEYRNRMEILSIYGCHGTTEENIDEDNEFLDEDFSQTESEEDHSGSDQDGTENDDDGTEESESEESDTDHDDHRQNGQNVNNLNRQNEN